MTAKPLSCALLSSFTLDRLPQLVSRSLEKEGVNCRWFVGSFNQYPQLILAPESELIAAAPQVVFLAVAIEDLLDQLPSPWSQTGQRKEAADRRIVDYVKLVKQLAARLPSARIFVHDFQPLGPESQPILSAQSSVSFRRLALEANLSLAGLLSECPNLSIVHLDDVFARQSRDSVCDPRYFYLAKMRFGFAAMDTLGAFYCRLLQACLGWRKKCLVLDLDNTLWGGVVGEDGMDALVLSNDGPGKAFFDFQRVLLEYYETGTLLAICSKNDESVALPVLQDHPNMLLRPSHFAAKRINWEDKATNLRAIAAELNLGVDSLVFLDDSEFERAEVRRLVPVVAVPDLPTDPSDYPSFAARLPFFDALTTTEDDRRRGQLYVEDRERRGLEQQAASLEDFLRDLRISVTIRRADSRSVPRIAQLTQRTNQFNLTTRRYTESDLSEMLRQTAWRVYCAHSSDRIGDAGIIGAALLEIDRSAATARLDTFLASCRILGRGIEGAFLAGVCSDLHALGLTTILGEYVPTERNALAREFLPKHGFVSHNGVWARPLRDASSLCPSWIRLQHVYESN